MIAPRSYRSETMRKMWSATQNFTTATHFRVAVVSQP